MIKVLTPHTHICIHFEVQHIYFRRCFRRPQKPWWLLSSNHEKITIAPPPRFPARLPNYVIIRDMSRDPPPGRIFKPVFRNKGAPLCRNIYSRSDLGRRKSFSAHCHTLATAVEISRRKTDLVVDTRSSNNTGWWDGRRFVTFFACILFAITIIAASCGDIPNVRQRSNTHRGHLER